MSDQEYSIWERDFQIISENELNHIQNTHNDEEGITKILKETWIYDELDTHTKEKLSNFEY